jgi:hypothetical protein
MIRILERSTSAYIEGNGLREYSRKAGGMFGFAAMTASERRRIDAAWKKTMKPYNKAIKLHAMGKRLFCVRDNTLVGGSKKGNAEAVKDPFVNRVRV